MSKMLARYDALFVRPLPYFIVAWLPLVTCVRRAAAVLIPAIMMLSRPKFTQNIYLWLLAGWCAFSLLWAPDPARALHICASLALLLLVYPTRELHVSPNGMHLATLVAVLFQTFLIWFGIGHKSVALLYAPVSLTLSLICAVYPSWLTILCSFWLAWIIDCDTTLLATLGLMIARYTPFVWLKNMWRALWIVVCLGLLGIHHMSSQNIQDIEKTPLPFSHLHRIRIYKEISRLVAEKPVMQQLMGSGLDSSRIVGKKELTFDITSGPHKGAHVSGDAFMHPHNGVLQILLELGWVGLVLAGLCVWKLPIYRKEEALVLYVAACHSLVSVGIWQAWWMASVWLAYWLASMRHSDGN